MSSLSSLVTADLRGGQPSAALAGEPLRQLRRLDPRARILLALSVPVAAATTPTFVPAAFAAYGTGLIGLLALAGAPAGGTLRRLGRFLPLVLMLALPLLWLPPAAGAAPAWDWSLPWRGGGELRLPGAAVAAAVAAKALIGCGSLLLLAALLPFEQLLAGLAGLGVPRRLLTLLQLTERYGQVLQSEAARMQVAYVARGGRRRWLWQARAVGQLIGALFVRSGERAERVHQAMLARGFDGLTLTGANAGATGGFGKAEWLWLLAVGLTLALVRGVLA